MQLWSTIKANQLRIESIVSLNKANSMINFLFFCNLHVQCTNTIIE